MFKFSLPNLPNISLFVILRIVQVPVAFLSMALSAATIAKTREHDIVFGADVYVLILSLMTMVFLALMLAGFLPLDRGRVVAIIHAVSEALQNILWFAAFIAAAVVHSSCDGGDDTNNKRADDDKDKGDFCGVGKATIIISVITWLTFCGTTATIGKQMWNLFRFDRSRTGQTDTERLAGYSNQQNEHFDGYDYEGRYESSNHYNNARRDSESWVSRESLDSIKQHQYSN